MTPYLDAPQDHHHSGPIELAMLIDGEWVPAASGQTIDSYDPFNQLVWSTIPAAGERDVADAIAAARAARRGPWGRMSGVERAARLFRLAALVESHAQRLARLETTDNGKVVEETARQAAFAAANYRYFAGWADKLSGRTIPVDADDIFDYTIREPVGVVALIIAWNSPLSLLSYKLAPALAAGNSVVIKPSEYASATTLEVARLALEAGFPRGVINVVTGAAEAGAAVTSLPGVDHISFTGGPETGALVAANAGRNLVPVTLELGGKSANIVFPDADLDRAAQGAAAAIFSASGQTCVAGSRLLVHGSIHEAFVARIADAARAIRLGDPLVAGTQMGPVANRPQSDRIFGFIRSAISDGATLLAGSDAPPVALAPGLFVSPTVFGDVAPTMDIAQREIFGPVLSVLRFSSEDEAIEIANGTPYGLAAGIWTSDLSRAPCGQARARRNRLGQHVPALRGPGTVRRIWSQRFRTRTRRRGAGSLSGTQERDDRPVGRCHRTARMMLRTLPC